MKEALSGIKGNNDSITDPSDGLSFTNAEG
jgi:hypothetical protein